MGNATNTLILKNEEAYEGQLPFTDSSSAFGMPCMVTSGAEALADC